MILSSAVAATIFAQTNAPSIGRFSPTSGSPGTTVTISGGNLTNATSVQFNQQSASFQVFSGELIAVAPAGATTGPIQVTTPSGTAVSADNFVVTGGNSAPTISSFSPAEGPVGTQVTILGSNLTQVTAVKFNGRAAAYLVSGNEITAAVPSGAETGPIEVDSPAGSVTSATPFTVSSPGAVTVSGFSPESGTPNTDVAISGANLDQVTAIEFNGVPAQFTPIGGDLVATVPASATTGPITLIYPGGSTATATSFKVLAAAGVSIQSFTPVQAPPGASVQITATNFSKVVSVQFSGVTAAFTVFGDIITATVPAGATSGPITVAADTGSALSDQNFVVLPPLGIAGFAPMQGAPGASVMIFGWNLASVSSVRFQGADAKFSFDGTNLMAVVPGAARSGPITIANATTNAVSADSFLVGASASLAVLASPTNYTGQVGTSLSLTLIVRNSGPLTASNVLFQATVPADLEIVSASATAGTILTNGNEVYLGIPSLPAGPPAAVFITVQPLAAGVFDLNASVNSATPDSNLADNSADLFVNVTGSTPPPAPPPLSVSLTNSNRLLLQWSAASSNRFEVQTTADLTPPAHWNSWTNSAAAIVGSTNQVTIPMTAPRGFFRLMLKSP